MQLTIFQPDGLFALGQVLMIDLVLAGDNAIVVGALASGLSARDRKRVIAVGIGAALVLRIAFALAATVLIGITGLLLAGGLLLLWVAWRFWRELRHHSADHEPHCAGRRLDALGHRDGERQCH